jgi:hypothetical protein
MGNRWFFPKNALWLAPLQTSLRGFCNGSDNRRGVMGFAIVGLAGDGLHGSCKNEGRSVCLI